MTQNQTPNPAEALHERIRVLEGQVAMWKGKARYHKNQAFTWRVLYHDLLREIGARLDITHTTTKGPTP